MKSFTFLTIKVADEVWIATALLHRERPEATDFFIEEIVERAQREGLHKPLRPGVYVHAVQHCVANRPPNPGRYRMLFETTEGRRRLFRMIGHFVTTTRRNTQEHGGMEIKIRRARAEDLTHILHHRLAMFEEMGFRDDAVLGQVEAVSREYFTEALRAGKYFGWMAEDSNGHVVGGGGIVVAEWPGYPGENHAKRAWILNMYTEREVRRSGVARSLMQAMVDWCRCKGYGSVSLHASDAGRPLYESMGFQPTNEMSLKLT